MAQRLCIIIITLLRYNHYWYLSLAFFTKNLNTSISVIRKQLPTFAFYGLFFCVFTYTDSISLLNKKVNDLQKVFIYISAFLLLYTNSPVSSIPSCISFYATSEALSMDISWLFFSIPQFAVVFYRLIVYIRPSIRLSLFSSECLLNVFFYSVKVIHDSIPQETVWFHAVCHVCIKTFGTHNSNDFSCFLICITLSRTGAPLISV